MCHPTGSGAGRIFFSGSFFVFPFLLSSVPPRAQADLPTKPMGNGLSSLPTKSALRWPAALARRRAPILPLASCAMATGNLFSRSTARLPLAAAGKSKRTEARNHGGHALEDPLGAWRGACPRVIVRFSPIAAAAARAAATRTAAATRAAAAGAIGIIVRFFSPIAATAARARAAARSFSQIATAAARAAAPAAAARALLSGFLALPFAIRNNLLAAAVPRHVIGCIGFRTCHLEQK